MTTFRIRVNPFQGVYLVRDPEVVESAMWGPMIHGEFRMEHSPDEPLQEGAFRVDRLDLMERVDEQLELRAA